MTTPTAIQQLRLMVGDVAQDLPFLEDNTYQWLLDSTTTQLDAAVEALEMIINQIALSPQSVRTEDIAEVGPMVVALESRLTSLKAKRQATKNGFPMIVKSDRKDWNDLNELFGRT
jgi:hypothetical protein